MKLCAGCGRYISDFDRLCPHCGHTDESMSEQETRKPEAKSSVPDRFQQEALRKEYEENGTYPYTRRESFRPAGYDAYPMKWHRFLMVMMIIVGIGAIISGVGYLTGFVYTAVTDSTGSTLITAEELYREFPGLKGWDIAYGIAIIGVGVYEIFVRNQLHAFRKNALKLLLLLYAGTLAVNIIYVIGAASALGYSVGDFLRDVDASSKAQIFRPVLFALINGVYYNKRRTLFVN